MRMDTSTFRDILFEDAISFDKASHSVEYRLWQMNFLRDSAGGTLEVS